MKKFTLNCVLILIAATALSVASIEPVRSAQFDCAHGPDTYRVRNVANWDMLNMRAGPTAGAPIVGRIPPHGSGVHCLGPCARGWCRVSWRGIVGWTNMRFLGE